MKQKKYLYTRRDGYFGSNRYRSFENESQTNNADISILPTTNNPPHSILDVLKLPEKSLPKKWLQFYTNGRTEFHTSCLILCSVLIKEPCFYFWKENDNSNSNQDAHAEMRALQSIATKEKSLHAEASLIILYLTYSPCGKCAESIISFLEVRPMCNMLLYFSCLYRHDKQALHRNGLRKLKACSGVKVLSVLTGKEWQELAARCSVKFVQNDNFRNYFDNYWKKELDHVLSEQQESGEQPWISKQQIPRLQYLEDGGDPILIQYEMQNNLARRSASQSWKRRKFMVVGNNKKSASAVIVILIVIIFFIAAIMNGWITTQESAPNFNVTTNDND